jgi:hypothetical protein
VDQKSSVNLIFPQISLPLEPDMLSALTVFSAVNRADPLPQFDKGFR